MSNPINEQKSDTNAPTQNISIGETDHSQVISPVNRFLSPSLVGPMNPNDICDYVESDYSNVDNRSGPLAYSPFLISNFYMGSTDMNKSFQNTYVGMKTESYFSF